VSPFAAPARHIRRPEPSGRHTHWCLSACLGAILLGDNATSAPAASLQERPDGKLLLTVLGEKAVIPRQFADRVFVFGRNAKTCVEDDPHPHFQLATEPPESLQNSLQRWLVDPIKAKCFESLAPTEKVDGISDFWITFPPDEWGSFSFPDLLELDFPQAGTHIKAVRMNPVGLTFGDQWAYSSDYCSSVSDNDKIDANGYRRKLLGPEFPVYLREQTTASPRRCISCNKISTWSCSENLLSNNARLRLQVSWSQEQDSSLPSWAVIDAAARKLFKALLPDRTEGD